MVSLGAGRVKALGSNQTARQTDRQGGENRMRSPRAKQMIKAESQFPGQGYESDTCSEQRL